MLHLLLDDGQLGALPLVDFVRVGTLIIYKRVDLKLKLKNI